MPLGQGYPGFLDQDSISAINDALGSRSGGAGGAPVIGQKMGDVGMMPPAQGQPSLPPMQGGMSGGISAPPPNMSGQGSVSGSTTTAPKSPEQEEALVITKALIQRQKMLGPSNSTLM